MTRPNFLIIGAAKSGTTSLYHYVRQHPDVYLSPIKEPNFFVFEGKELNLCGPVGEDRMFKLIYRNTITEAEDYAKLFRLVNRERAIGEASPRYLYFPDVPRRIKHYLGDPRLIVILRNPVDRAHSHFRMNRQRGLEPLEDFEQALAAEEERVRERWDWDWHYVRLGMYSRQLKPYIDLFGRDRLRIYLYDELCQDPLALVQDVFRFLGVDDRFVPDVSKKYGVSATVEVSAVNRLVFSPEDTWIGDLAGSLLPRSLRLRLQNAASSVLRSLKPPPGMAPDIRSRLQGVFREDVARLQELIGRDLSAWSDHGPSSSAKRDSVAACR